MKKKVISITMILFLLLAPAAAGQYSDGYSEGKNVAHNEHDTTGCAIGGLIWGYSLGIFGVGLSYGLAGYYIDVPSEDLINMEREHVYDYVKGYEDGYEKIAGNKNRFATLFTSLLGWAIKAGTGK